MPSTIHPFLVDQTPYLPRSSSSSSIHSTSSITSSSSSTSKYSHTPSSSISSTTTRELLYRTTSNTSTNTIASTSNQNMSQNDLTCLRFMRTTDEGEHFFGSVSSRGSSLSKEERSLRREMEGAAEEEARRREVKKGRRVGRLF